MSRSETRTITASLLALLLAVNAQARTPDQQWFAATTESSVVFSNQSLGTPTRVLAQLLAARTAIKQLAGVEIEIPVRVFAVKDEQGLRQLVPQYWERRGVRPQAASYLGAHAAFIAVRADVPVLRQFPLLIHEYVHLLTDLHAPQAPAWLDEGLSEFWGALAIEGSKIVVGRPPSSHLKLLRTRPWLPMEELLRRDRTELGRSQEQVVMFYAQSWAIVHYLLLGRSETAPLAFLPADTQQVAQFESAIREYVEEGHFREVVVSALGMKAAPAVTSPISEARALAERAEMLVFGERPDAALPLVRKALALEPRQPLALEVMGSYYFLRNQPEPAREWLSRSLETNPINYRAALYMALLSASPEARERYLMAAVRAEPSSTLAWQRLWTLYEEDDRAASARRWCQALPRLPLLWMRVNLLPGCRS